MEGTWLRDSFATLETRALLDIITCIKKNQSMEWKNILLLREGVQRGEGGSLIFWRGVRTFSVY